MSGQSFPGKSLCQGVLVRMSQTEWLINSRHPFLTIPEARTSKIMVFLLYPHMEDGLQDLFQAAFIRVLIPFSGALTSGPITPRGPTSKRHHLGA